jgi:hypothetical protein
MIAVQGVITTHSLRPPIKAAFTSKLAARAHIFCDSTSPTNALSVQ